MTVPNYPDKHREKAMLRPEHHVDSEDEVPETVVLTYQPDFWDWLVAERLAGEIAVEAPFSVHGLEGNDDAIGFAGDFGIGAPITAAVVEHLCVRGTERFVVLGGCGVLQSDIRGDEALLVEDAIRDEGTSHHYLESARTVSGSEAVLAGLEATATDLDVPARVGTTWTTDAIYRETQAEVDHYASEGVLCVEMEVAAVFAVSRYRGLNAGAILAPFDSLCGDEWVADVGGPEEKLERLLPVVRRAFRGDSRTTL